jgi:hypothetical protein
LPKLCRPHHLVADRGCVVDQDVDAAVVAFDLSEQSLGLFVVSVIDSDGDAPAASSGHHRRRVVDGARSPRLVCASGASGHIHGAPVTSERMRNASACAATRSRNNGHHVVF